MRCLDSDILVGILRNNEDAIKMSHKIDEEGGAFTTSINAFEILAGARLSLKQKNIDEAKKLLAKLGILNFDEKSADKASQLLGELKKSGKIIDFKDIFIASISIENGCKLVTRNIKDFSKIKEIAIEKW